MNAEANKKPVVVDSAIPESHRLTIHAYNLTCTFSCVVGKRDGETKIVSSNLNPNCLNDAERKAIIRGDGELTIKRESNTFVYHLVNKRGSTRVYRVVSHTVNFGGGK